MKVTVRNTTISASMDLIKFQTSLEMIAAYAKAANQMDLYNKVKEAHDNISYQFNARNTPKKKGFWQQFKDNLLGDMDTTTVIPLRSLEESFTFKPLYEAAKKLSYNELIRSLEMLVDKHNKLYGE